MRIEIIQALATADRLRLAQQDWTAQHIPAGQIPPGDYSSMLSPEQRQTLQHVFDNITALQRCCQTIPQVFKVEMGTTTSIEVYADQHNYAVIECSIDGKLATIFMYGTIAFALLQQLKQCIVAHGLLLLTEQERNELEIQGVYHNIF